MDWYSKIVDDFIDEPAKSRILHICSIVQEKVIHGLLCDKKCKLLGSFFLEIGGEGTVLSIDSK